jgi:hypothetical protein
MRPLLAPALFFLCAVLLGPPASAQTAPDAAKGPGMETEALDALKAMATRLTEAKTLSFTAVATYQHPAMNGQPLWYTTLSDVTLQRPNHLRIVTPGDGPATEFYYDGKTMIAYDPNANLAAVAPAPADLDGMIKLAYDRAAIYFPFVDLLVADPLKAITEDLTSAFFIGQSHVVGSTTTDMIAVAGPNIEAQLWIGADDHLPRLIRAIYPKDPGREQHSVAFYHWQLDGKLPPGAFVSAKAAKAPHIDFAKPEPAAKTN